MHGKATTADSLVCSAPAAFHARPSSQFLKCRDAHRSAGPNPSPFTSLTANSHPSPRRRRYHRRPRTARRQVVLCGPVYSQKSKRQDTSVRQPHFLRLALARFGRPSLPTTPQNLPRCTSQIHHLVPSPSNQNTNQTKHHSPKPSRCAGRCSVLPHPPKAAP